MRVTGSKAEIMPAETLMRGVEIAEIQLDSLKASIRKNPGRALVTALMFGLVVGLVVRRI